MIARAEVVVLGAIKYGDNSIILKTYSRESGPLSFIAGTKSRKGPLRRVMTQPLSQLEIVYYNSQKSDLKRIKEARINHPYSQLLFDPLKNCIALFLAEVLKDVLKNEDSNPALYDFLSQAFLMLDQMEEGTANFHLCFLYKLLEFGGFQPEEPGAQPIFDLMSGTYCSEEPPHAHFLKPVETMYWKDLAARDFSQLPDYRPGQQARKNLLERLIHYFRLHYHDFHEPRSLAVLQAVLH